MSLDVYLVGPEEMVECVCRECDHRHERKSRPCFYSANITHNLGAMADAAGIYLALWRPGQMLAPEIHKRICEQQEAKNYHGPGGVFELEDTLPVAHARDLIEPLRAGLALLKSDRARFEAFNASNGWGTYKHFVPFVEKYLAACEENPDAVVEVSR